MPSLSPVKSAVQSKARVMWGCAETCGCEFHSSLAKSRLGKAVCLSRRTSIKQPLVRSTAESRLLCGASSNGPDNRYEWSAKARIPLCEEEGSPFVSEPP